MSEQDHMDEDEINYFTIKITVMDKHLFPETVAEAINLELDRLGVDIWQIKTSKPKYITEEQANKVLGGKEWATDFSYSAPISKIKEKRKKYGRNKK